MSAPVPPLWLCADLDHPAAGELVARVAAVVAATPACVWLRGGASARAMLSVARSLRDLTRADGCALVVGDRIDVATLAEADGVHLPGRGVAPDDARRVSAAWLSAAVHDEAEIAAARGRVDVMVLSPFGAVAGKGEALGVARFAALRADAGCPVIALGGITGPAEARAARAAGADGVAVRRALMDAGDPAAACAALAEALAHRGD